MKPFLLATGLAVCLAGCDLPDDPEQTLEAVRGHELRVGVLNFGENAAKDRPIVERLAASTGSKLVYLEGDAHALFADLKQGKIHLVVGGVPKSTPFKNELGLSKSAGPLFGGYDKEEERVLAVRAGENGFLLRVNQAIEEAKSDGGRS